MDYELSIDPIGDPVARCSMGHEAVGYWLTNEVSRKAALLDRLLEAIRQLQSRQTREYRLEGREYSIELSRDEVIISAHALFADTDELSGELDYYDSESHAQCGLEDFAALLNDWCQFIGLPQSA